MNASKDTGYQAEEQTTTEKIPENPDQEEKEGYQEQEDLQDLSRLTKRELYDYLKQLKDETSIRRLREQLHLVKEQFDERLEREKQEALRKFIEEGNDEGDFDYKGEDIDGQFRELYKELKNKEKEKAREAEKTREENLKKKQAVLDRLRQLIDVEEENENSFKEVKELQKQWKSIGPVPQGENNDLWSNYKALINRYYNNRTIYFELKELDRKKNLEAKQDVCARAEKLYEEEVDFKTLKKLNELHNEFKHIGPAPRDQEQQVYNRLKEVSDKIHEKAREFKEQFKQQLQENYNYKLELCEAIEGVKDFNSDNPGEWKKKIREVLDIQEKWKNTGSVPREKAKELTKRFWAANKTFFNNKNRFFKQVEQQKSDNLTRKQELCEKAEELKDNTDNIEETADKLKALQEQWKKTGPVPNNKKDEIARRFRKACDEFFEKKREVNKEQEKDFEVNSQKKTELCEKLEQAAENGNGSEALLKEVCNEWEGIGLVLKKDVNNLQNRFLEAVEKLVGTLDGIEDKERERLKIMAEVSLYKGAPNASRKLKNRERKLRDRKSQLDKDIQTLNTNKEFLSPNSESGRKWKEQIDQQIKDVEKEKESIEEKLDLIEELEEV